jgi:hypothetical protein
VTVCHEVQYCEAVDHSKRGFATKIAASFRSLHAGDSLRLLRELRQCLPRRGIE